MRYFSFFFLAFLVTVFFPGAIKMIEAWEGKFADGTPLTRKKLEELLATHRKWSGTFDEKNLDKEIAKVRAKAPSVPI
jgi:hypothetical protein